MSERGGALTARASRQLDEMAEFLGALDAADLGRPCPDESGESTVGAVAAHMAEGYHLLGRLLQTTGDAPGPAGAGNGHGHGRTSATLPEVMDRLSGARTPVGLIQGLTDEQLASVPPAVNRFADGRRTLEQVIDEVIAHQAKRLARLRRAVG